MDHKDISIVVQVAHKNAAELFHGTGNVDAYLEAAPRIAAALLGEIREWQASVPAGQPQYAQPGPAVAAPDPIQQATNNLHAGGIQTTPVGGGGGEPGKWPHFFANPDQYYINFGDARASSGGGNGPDFKHKDSGKGLWLLGKYPASDETWTKLIQMGVVNENHPAVPASAKPF